MFCSKCGADVEHNAQYCPNCGAQLYETRPNNYQTRAQQSPQYVTPLKNGGLAAVLSFIIPGAGVIYAGQIGKGLLYFIIGALVTIATVFIIFAGILFLVFWVWQIYDAYNITEEYNNALRATGQPPW